jgi:hypothetical protein
MAALGAEKLVQLILDEAKVNAPFRKKANAALAAAKGPEAVAALIDRHLSALEKAQATVDWEKEKDFAADLAATVDSIVKELGQADAALADERLPCFACPRIASVAWAALRPPDDTPFPRIASARRFRCSNCGERGCSLTPDWRVDRAPGTGRP